MIVKVEEYDSVRCRVFNGSNGSFPLILGRHIIQRSFLYRHRYFRFFPKLFLYRSCPFFQEGLRMPRTESSSAISQDYLDFYYTSSAISLLGSSLGPQYKNGPRSQIVGPHNSPSKSCCPTSWSGRRISLMSGLYHGLPSFVPD